MSNNDSHTHPDLPESLSTLLNQRDHLREFAVPENYFVELQAELLLRIRHEKNTDEFAAPAGYFSDAANRILSAVETGKDQEAFFSNQQSQIMTEIRLRGMIGDHEEFVVPEGYFEHASTKIKVKIFGAKVFQLRKWLSYAAAASVLIASLFFFLPKHDRVEEESFAALINKNPVDEDDLEYFSDEEDVFDLYITLMEDDTTIVDSLTLTTPNQQLMVADSLTNKKIKLDPKTGLPIDPSGKGKAVSWEDLTDEELMQYLFEEGDEEILNEIE